MDTKGCKKRLGGDFAEKKKRRCHWGWISKLYSGCQLGMGHRTGKREEDYSMSGEYL